MLEMLGNYTQELMAHTPRKFQAICIYYTKSEESSGWVLYSSLICLRNYPTIWWLIVKYYLQANQSKSQLSKGAKNWLCKTKMQHQEENQNSIKISWKARNKPPKGHTKTRPFVFAQFQRIGYATYYIQEWNPKNKLYLNLMGHQS